MKRMTRAELSATQLGTWRKANSYKKPKRGITLDAKPILLRLTPDLREYVETAAEFHGMPVPAFIRVMLYREAAWVEGGEAPGVCLFRDRSQEEDKT